MRPFTDVSSNDVTCAPGRHAATRLMSPNSSHTTARGLWITKLSSKRVQPGRNDASRARVGVSIFDVDRLAVEECAVGSNVAKAAAVRGRVTGVAYVPSLRFSITDAMALTMPT